MKIIYRKPQTGKTTELIKKCARNGGYIVCANLHRADFVMKMAREMNLKIAYPLTFDELLERRYFAKGIRKVYIDNADELIRYIAKGLEVDSIVMDDWEDQEGIKCKIDKNNQTSQQSKRRERIRLQ